MKEPISWSTNGLENGPPTLFALLMCVHHETIVMLEHGMQDDLNLGLRSATFIIYINMYLNTWPQDSKIWDHSKRKMLIFKHENCMFIFK